MKKLAISTALGALVVSTMFGIPPTAAASGATPRADGYMTASLPRDRIVEAVEGEGEP